MPLSVRMLAADSQAADYEVQVHGLCTECHCPVATYGCYPEAVVVGSKSLGGHLVLQMRVSFVCRINQMQLDVDAG